MDTDNHAVKAQGEVEKVNGVERGTSVILSNNKDKLKNTSIN